MAAPNRVWSVSLGRLCQLLPADLNGFRFDSWEGRLRAANTDPFRFAVLNLPGDSETSGELSILPPGGSGGLLSLSQLALYPPDTLLSACFFSGGAADDFRLPLPFASVPLDGGQIPFLTGAVRFTPQGLRVQYGESGFFLGNLLCASLASLSGVSLDWYQPLVGVPDGPDAVDYSLPWQAFGFVPGDRLSGLFCFRLL